MNRRTTRATAILLTAIGGMLLGASCTSNSEGGRAPNEDQPQATGTTAPLAALELTTWTVLGPATDGAITEVSLVDEQTLVLSVAHGACDQLEGWSEQGVDSVVVGVWVRDIETHSDDPDVSYGCDDEGLEDPVEVKLENSLGDRELIVVQSKTWRSHDQPVCFHPADDAARCLALTIRIGGVDQAVAAGPTANPTDIEIGSGVVTPLTIGSTSIEVMMTTELTNPLFWYRYTLWRPADAVWGSVMIHNLERDASKLEPFEHLIDGRQAMLIEYFDAGPGDLPVIAIPVGPWWIDITVQGTEPGKQQARQDQFLQGLSITEIPGDMPHLEDATSWLSGTGELNVVSGHIGFVLGVSPNCDPAIEAYCVPDVGHVGGAWSIYDSIAGTTPDPLQPPFELAVPAGLNIIITDMGPVGELLACEGFPAFDPLLLSKSLTFLQATEETRIYTGISDWERRIRPGTETWFAGGATSPIAIATYVRNGDGTWDAESVLTCQ